MIVESFMPRKNARPAAKKRLAQQRAKMGQKAKPQKRIAIIAHRPDGRMSGLALLAASLLRKSSK